MSDSKPRMFPILADHGRNTKPAPTSIPWSVADKAYHVYRSRYGSGQSLERLAERGGFGANEMDEFYPGWRDEVSELAQLRAERDALRGLWTAEPPQQDGFYWWRRDAFRPGAVVEVMGDTAYYLGKKRHVPAQGGEWSGPLLPPTDDYRARAALGGGATGGTPKCRECNGRGYDPVSVHSGCATTYKATCKTCGGTGETKGG